MGSNKTPDNLRGFLLPHDMDSSNIWSSESTYTSSNTQPAQPKPGGDYDLGLTSTGSHDTTDTIRVQTQRAGHIGRASFVWREDDETDFYGYDAPNAIARWDSIINGSTATLNDNILLDALGNDDGTSVILYQFKEQAISQERRIRASKRTVTGGITTTTIFTQSSTGTPTLYGGLCKLSDGSILAVYMEANADAANLQSARSYDNGSTWSVQSKTCLPSDIDLTGSFGAGNTGFDHINRIRIAESRGEILLIIAAVAHNTTPASTDLVLQYVSTDNGCSFVHVADNGGTFAYFRPDLIVKNNSFYIGYISATGQAEIVELESATIQVDIAKLFSPPEITDLIIAGGLTQGHFTKGQFSMWTNETGRIYAVFHAVTLEEQFFILQSDDATNWFYLGGNPLSNQLEASQIYNIDDNQSRPSVLAGCNARGVNQLFHNYETRTHTRDNGIHCFELGTWTTVSLPAVKEFPLSYDFGGWDRTWCAYDKPDDTTEYTAFGSGTITAQAEYTEFSTTTSQNKFVRSAAITSTSSEGIILRTRLRAIQEGSNTSGRGVNITTNDNSVNIWINTNAIYVEDDLGSSSISNYTMDTTTTFEILASIANNKLNVWVNQNADRPRVKRWINIASATVTSGGGYPNQYVRFGHITTTSGATQDTETEWYEMHFSYGDRTGAQLDGQTNPEDLNARQYPPKGQYVYLTDGVKISTFDGPAYRGEFYDIEPDSLYPIRRIFHTSSPTPRQVYRSANETEQKIALYWDTTLQATANGQVGSDSIGVYLGNINFRSFDVDVYDQSTTSWVNLDTVNNKIGGTTWERVGNVIRSTNASPTGGYVELDECKGYSFDFGGGVVRKIKGNTAGYLNNSTTTIRAVLFLEDFDNSDPTTISTGYLIPNQVVYIRHLAGATPGAAIRITIDAQDTADGYFQIGAFFAGPFIAPQQYSNGRTITHTPGIETSETQDGVRRTRKVHDGYRNIRIAWTQGVDVSELFEATSADYYTGTTAGGALPISAPADTPYTMVNLLRKMDGESKPLVYIPSIPVSIKQDYIGNSRNELFYGTIQGEISIEHVIGNENDSEVFRVSTMNIREII